MSSQLELFTQSQLFQALCGDMFLDFSRLARFTIAAGLT